ncbi:MAG: aminotransferase class III-fold pyridoxal phosphate-dependent enzyme [Spirochaetaceae bacterium]|nr:MAG: aminotransferase class III-fold pyridoxal phosphate-dependent enzyme [Spirochaetaceae bacterium]
MNQEHKNGADRLTQEYVRSHRGSLSLHSEAERHFAAAGATHAARVADPCRPYITHAAGSRKWDVDGNEYIDYTMGHGALILGHSHPAVVSAVREQAGRGLHYGENHELEIRWAELIARMMPIAERIEFCAAGQEANMMAIRLARVYTGRRRILRLRYNYHGWAEGLVAPGAPGCITTDDVTEVPMNDLAAVERALSGAEYALLLSEGGGARMAGQLPVDLDFQRALPHLAHRYGTLYCIDEVVTGFRDSPGGWQQLIGVTPDLATLGKCVGGGLPVGAVVGRADIFDSLNPAATPDRLINHAGTWNANPLSCAAGAAACSLYLDGTPQRQAAESARRFRDRGNRLLRDMGISGRLHGRSIVHLYLGPIERDDFDPDFEAPSTDIEMLAGTAHAAAKTRFKLHLLQRGVATLRGGMFIFSAAHDAGDVEATLAVLQETLHTMHRESSIPAQRTS